MQKIAKKVKKIQNNNLSYPVGLWYAIIIIGFKIIRLCGSGERYAVTA